MKIIMPILGFVAGCLLSLIFISVMGGIITGGDTIRMFIISTVFLSGIITGCSAWIVSTLTESQKSSN